MKPQYRRLATKGAARVGHVAFTCSRIARPALLRCPPARRARLRCRDPQNDGLAHAAAPADDVAGAERRQIARSGGNGAVSSKSSTMSGIREVDVGRGDAPFGGPLRNRRGTLIRKARMASRSPPRRRRRPGARSERSPSFCGRGHRSRGGELFGTSKESWACEFARQVKGHVTDSSRAWCEPAYCGFIISIVSMPAASKRSVAGRAGAGCIARRRIELVGSGGRAGRPRLRAGSTEFRVVGRYAAKAARRAAARRQGKDVDFGPGHRRHRKGRHRPDDRRARRDTREAKGPLGDMTVSGAYDGHEVRANLVPLNPKRRAR